MNYLAVLGRQATISLAELGALFSNVRQITPNLATFFANSTPDINRLGGTLKLAVQLDQKPLDYLANLPAGKITLGISDYSDKASPKSAITTALKLKKILVRHHRSVRVVENKTATLSTATSLHNGLSSKNNRKVELIKVNNNWYQVVGIQNIDAYAQRDQARPARDARVGMLPPKLAQVLINLCGPLPARSRILDPFCGTGVVLQEALLMGYCAYGTDLNPRMIEYAKKNLHWLATNYAQTGDRYNSKQFFSEHRELLRACLSESHKDGREREREEKNLFRVDIGDATSHKWHPPIDAVACESYLGQPMSNIPSEIKLKQQKQECTNIILGFLKNLSNQIEPGTPVTIATPTWLRPDGTYERLGILAFLEDLGYNVDNKSREGLIYHRDGQIVARDIIILRKT